MSWQKEASYSEADLERAEKRGYACAEREMRTPMACGHPRACWTEEPRPTPKACVLYCSACRREEPLRAALRDFVDASSPPKDGCTHDEEYWYCDVCKHEWEKRIADARERAESLVHSVAPEQKGGGL